MSGDLFFFFPLLKFMADIPQSNASIRCKMTVLSHRCDSGSLYQSREGAAEVTEKMSEFHKSGLGESGCHLPFV